MISCDYKNPIGKQIQPNKIKLCPLNKISPSKINSNHHQIFFVKTTPKQTTIQGYNIY